MIIELILDVIYNLLHHLIYISIPKLPETIFEYINPLVDYISAGAGILSNYTPLTYILSLFGVVLAIDVGVAIYHFVMWVLKKIPFLGME